MWRGHERRGGWNPWLCNDREEHRRSRKTRRGGETRGRTKVVVEYTLGGSGDLSHSLKEKKIQILAGQGKTTRTSYDYNLPTFFIRQQTVTNYPR